MAYRRHTEEELNKEWFEWANTKAHGKMFLKTKWYKKGSARWAKMRFIKCPICEQERWVRGDSLGSRYTSFNCLTCWNRIKAKNLKIKEADINNLWEETIATANLGDLRVKLKRKLDRSGKRANWFSVYAQIFCPKCNKEQWVLKYGLKYSRKSLLCPSCASTKNVIENIRIADNKVSRESEETVKTKYMGEIKFKTKYAREKSSGNISKFFLLKCPDCKKDFWARRQSIMHRKSHLCFQCCLKYKAMPIGEKNPNWKGGSISRGYRIISIPSTDKYAAMGTRNSCGRNSKRILEHRYVMAKHLGRNIEPHFHVHHLNGNKIDNRIENLILLDANTHFVCTKMEKHINVLERIIKDAGLEIPDEWQKPKEILYKK